MKKYKIASKIFLILMIAFIQLFAQKPYRLGTTTANFLEIGYGASATALGDAFTSVCNDASAIYWNPAGLASLSKPEVLLSYQPWYAGINTTITAAAVNVDNLGTFALGIIGVDYGEMDVTSLDMQKGTGETFTAKDIAISLAFSRKLATWFSFGIAGKYVSSKIWHSDANALAFDLGVLINTGFFSPTKNVEDGLNIGMSVSNYGTPMKFEGMDMLQPIDPTPGDKGDYKDAEGQYKLGEWELPLIFRLGVSMNLIKSGNHSLLVAVDALHPNNNSESVNVGASYAVNFTGIGRLGINCGYKGLFMEDNQFGYTFGAEIQSYLLYNTGWKINYSYRQHKVFSGTHSYGISVYF